eukprot:11614094-Ditylum_brightwellii.AAC.1
MDYSKEVKNIDVKKQDYDGANGLFPGIGSFKNFLSIYLDKACKHRTRLMFLLLKSYVAKANGYQNPDYGAK